jgi:hypothetical protein
MFKPLPVTSGGNYELNKPNGEDPAFALRCSWLLVTSCSPQVRVEALVHEQVTDMKAFLVYRVYAFAVVRYAACCSPPSLYSHSGISRYRSHSRCFLRNNSVDSPPE